MYRSCVKTLILKTPAAPEAESHQSGFPFESYGKAISDEL